MRFRTGKEITWRVTLSGVFHGYLVGFLVWLSIDLFRHEPLTTGRSIALGVLVLANAISALAALVKAFQIEPEVKPTQIASYKHEWAKESVHVATWPANTTTLILNDGKQVFVKQDGTTFEWVPVVGAFLSVGQWKDVGNNYLQNGEWSQTQADVKPEQFLRLSQPTDE
jgi:hypothetical protein